MDRETAKRIQRELTAAVEMVCETNGLKIRGNRVTFHDFGLSFKVDVVPAGDEYGREAAELQAAAHLIGVKPEVVGAEIGLAGMRYTVLGISPKASKKPVIVRRVSDGVVGNVAEAHFVKAAVAAGFGL